MIPLGAKVRDRLTGFEGVTISRHDYLYGCTRYSVRPCDLKDGKQQEPEGFDEPQLEVLDQDFFRAERPAGMPTGGPRNDPHLARP